MHTHNTCIVLNAVGSIRTSPTVCSTRGNLPSGERLGLRILTSYSTSTSRCRGRSVDSHRDPGQFSPSPSHRFISALERRGKLLRNYTQNIDTLEQAAGITKVLHCHGEQVWERGHTLGSCTCNLNKNSPLILFPSKYLLA